MTGSILSLASGLAKTLAGGALGGVPLTLLAPSIGTNTPAAANASANTPADPEQAKITKTAHQFEAIFLRQMLTQARQSHFGNDMFSSQAMDSFGSMEDSHLADVAASRDTLGIAKMLENAISHRLGLAVSGQTLGQNSAPLPPASASGAISAVGQGGQL